MTIMGPIKGDTRSLDYSSHVPGAGALFGGCGLPALQSDTLHLRTTSKHNQNLGFALALSECRTLNPRP